MIPTVIFKIVNSSRPLGGIEKIRNRFKKETQHFLPELLIDHAIFEEKRDILHHEWVSW